MCFTVPLILSWLVPVLIDRNLSNVYLKSILPFIPQSSPANALATANLFGKSLLHVFIVLFFFAFLAWFALACVVERNYRRRALRSDLTRHVDNKGIDEDGSVAPLSKSEQRKVRLRSKRGVVRYVFLRVRDVAMIKQKSREMTLMSGRNFVVCGDAFILRYSTWRKCISLISAEACTDYGSGE